MIKNNSHSLSSYPQSQRKKPELLSPAGTMECFFAAVENGADAVYLGLNDFSARASAENFSIDNASKVIAYAHERHIKVYIALNTLIKTNELDKVVDYLIALEGLQPDAIILQDLGLLSLIQSQFPQFTVHASTQMAIHTIALLRDRGLYPRGALLLLFRIMLLQQYDRWPKRKSWALRTAMQDVLQGSTE